MACEVILKGTKVDGVYDKDPVKFSDAKRYTDITYDDVLAKHLAVMDASASWVVKIAFLLRRCAMKYFKGLRPGRHPSLRHRLLRFSLLPDGLPGLPR